MLYPDDIPCDESGYHGAYTLRCAGVNESYQDACFVDGVAERVSGRAAVRLALAFGAACSVHPADDDVAALVADWLEKNGKPERAAVVLAEYTQPAKAAPPKGPSEPEAPEPETESEPEPEAPKPSKRGRR